MKTDELISRLSKDAPPVRRLPRPELRLAAWLAGTLAAVAAGALAGGCRADLASALGSAAFRARALAGLAVAALAALGALSSAVPGRERSAAARLLPAAALAGWVLLLCADALRAREVHAGLFQWHCVGHIAALAAAPAALLYLMLRRAAPVRPALSGGLAVLAAASAANLGTQFICANDSAAHALVSHLLPVVAAALLGAAAARRALRW
jgi:hypothetical protein